MELAYGFFAEFLAAEQLAHFGKILQGKSAHSNDRIMRLLYCQGRRFQQTVVQSLDGYFLAAVGVCIRGIADSNTGKLFEKLCKRQEADRYHDVEKGMEICYPAHVDRVVPEREAHSCLYCVHHHKKSDSADNVEIKVYRGSPLCVFARARGGYERRYAGADVLSHNYGESRRKFKYAAV